MHNPYATSPAGERASHATPFATPESARTADYNDAIGPRSGYYLPRFARYDARGSSISWHWPAFFATSSWYVYRKLYLLGILNFFYPWILWFVLGLLIGLRVVPPTAGGLAVILLSPVPWILLTVFANRIYWRRINRVIEEMPAYPDPGRRSRALAEEGGVARGPMVAMVVVTALFGFGTIGVLAAIAIPAYQDYTLRAQVVEGLRLADPVKGQVAEHWERHQRWPEQADIHGEVPSGKYVQSVTVAQGSVIITYGGAANRKLQGMRVALMPGVDASGDIVWACGYATLPPGTKANGGLRGSDLPAKYLPANCRG